MNPASTMIMKWREWFRRKETRPVPDVVITQSCIHAIQECLGPEIRKHHEGVAYLLGGICENATVIVSAIRPAAQTTPGSFAVDRTAMAHVVRSAVDRKLQVVGQVHTHPGEAYHSDGDNEGARIAYAGYVSVVLPFYGKFLPALTEAAAYVYRPGGDFAPVDVADISIVAGVMK